MSEPQPILHCPNPTCPAPQNDLGQSVCQTCQTLLVYRYLWVVGTLIETIAPEQLMADRYWVVQPRLWLDTQPSQPPQDWQTSPIAPSLASQIKPYLPLYPARLHIPSVYGVCGVGGEVTDPDPSHWVILLENIPVAAHGQWLPTLEEAWQTGSAVRQVYWLWQSLQLWEKLTVDRVASSLLDPQNLFAEGWRLRLRELMADDPANPPTLAQLGQVWWPWVLGAHPGVTDRLQELCRRMQQPDITLPAIASSLNRLLLEQTTHLPLRLQVAGQSDPGPQRSHNEDACYPSLSDPGTTDPLVPRLAIVCDGIGGHEGGEVASQLAVRSLRLQIQALLAEVEAQPEPVEPDLLIEQLAATMRVVNNLIAAQNDAQGRTARQRMATTLVMALQITQSVRTQGQSGKAHELYLAHVGDSRAYWITPHYCQLLTLDDDVVTREVRLGRSLRSVASQRPDALALTQALGTRNAEDLHPTVQRFLIEEDGLLLLCSDGLSDRGWVEQFWADYAEPVLQGKMSVTEAAAALVDLGNRKNGYDNTTVVLTACWVTPEFPVERLELARVTSPTLATNEPVETELMDSARALLDSTADFEELDRDAQTQSAEKRSRPFPVLLGLLIVLLMGTVGGAALWYRFDPQGFAQFRQSLQIPWLRGRSVPSPASPPPLTPPTITPNPNSNPTPNP